jgi:hypothetical protein
MNIPATRSRTASRFAQFIMALAVAGMTCSAGAQGEYLGTLFSGLWSAIGESGEGVTATHEEPVIFLTFFVYRGDRTPYWLTATVTRAPDSGDSIVYTGDLYETSGPGISPGPFDSASVTYRKVGAVSWVSSDGITVTLTFSIDGVAITKTLRRFTLHNLDFSGSYAGAIAYQTQSCNSPSLNGRTVVDYGLTIITQPPGSLTLVLHGANATCTFSGAYLQLGSLGNADGTLSCTDGSSGHFTLALMQRTFVGFTAAFGGSNQQCGDIIGTLSGIITP